MTKYLALLRGINVGGKSRIAMTELKKAFEATGLRNVRTYINSGNVIFESNLKDKISLEERLEKAIKNNFGLNSAVIVLTDKELKKVVTDAPSYWKKQKNIRKYVTFVKSPHTAKEVLQKVRLREGVDSVKDSKGVLYMTTLLSGITKSGFTRLAAKPIYKFLTIRNFNTVLKIMNLISY